MPAGMADCRRALSGITVTINTISTLKPMNMRPNSRCTTPHPINPGRRFLNAGVSVLGNSVI